ncbi:MAG: lecithin retinol acyltransferase family protein [Balneola sp.]
MKLRKNLTPGTVISVPKGIITHVGVVTGRRHMGRPTVIANTPRYGKVIEQTIDDFCSGMNFKVVSEPKNFFQGHKAVQRASQLIGKPYNALSYNCEHLITDAFSLKPESPQLQKWTALSLLVGTGLLFLSTSNQ